MKKPSGGTEPLGDCSFSYSAASYKTSDSDPTPTITGDAGGVFSSTVGLVINSATGEITLATSTIASYVVTYTVSGKICTQNLEVTAGAIANVFSFLLDGVDDYMTASDITDFGTGDFSVSLWINGTDSTSSYYLGSDPSPYSSTGFGIVRHNTLPSSYLGSPRLWLVGSGVNGTTNVNDGNWHNVVVTRESNGVRNYVDGSEEVLHDDSNVVVASPYTMSGTISITDTIIGGLTSSTEFWAGNIDEIAVWNSALSASDVSDIYNETSTGKTADLSLMDTPPVVWYRMGD